ncbi:MAG: DUF4846 domain-containing protein [Spirochaetes bacterium]|nr:DUF4846 domain-containing protein [Spirochaetota bacterium]
MFVRVVISVLLLFITSDFLDSQCINKSKKSVAERFTPPKGYVRRVYPESTFQSYLSNLPLKKYGVPVLLYNGKIKAKDVHVSVLDIPILDKDLIQCADAIIKLRAEYLYQNKRYDEISFDITNGMNVPFGKFMVGYRVIVKGNDTNWKMTNLKTGYIREIFDEYLEFIYIYSGTLSLSKEMKSVKIDDIEAGDVFIQGGSPGHAVIIIDLAENEKTGEKVMLLAQSYMPSQEIHILKSFSNISPWYKVEDKELITPEWKFKKGSMKRF